MAHQIEYLAALAYIDVNLDELKEEFGDLPDLMKSIEKKVTEKKVLAEETEEILKEIRQFCSTAKKTLVELKDKEEKLAKQQFMVRNNKEFDAITKEIEHLKAEHLKLSDKLRSEGIKEENLLKILQEQKEALSEAEKELVEKSNEFETLESNQNDEVKILFKKRKKLLPKILKHNIKEYERIRRYHSETVTGVRRNSCNGCYSAIPPQKIVEIRNNLDTLYYCENCGRLLYPEDLLVNDEFIDQLD